MFTSGCCSPSCKTESWKFSHYCLLLMIATRNCDRALCAAGLTGIKSAWIKYRMKFSIARRSFCCQIFSHCNHPTSLVKYLIWCIWEILQLWGGTCNGFVVSLQQAISRQICNVVTRLVSTLMENCDTLRCWRRNMAAKWEWNLKIADTQG